MNNQKTFSFHPSPCSTYPIYKHMQGQFLPSNNGRIKLHAAVAVKTQAIVYHIPTLTSQYRTYRSQVQQTRCSNDYTSINYIRTMEKLGKMHQSLLKLACQIANTRNGILYQKSGVYTPNFFTDLKFYLGLILPLYETKYWGQIFSQTFFCFPEGQKWPKFQIPIH